MESSETNHNFDLETLRILDAQFECQNCFINEDILEIQIAKINFEQIIQPDYIEW